MSTTLVQTEKVNGSASGGSSAKDENSLIEHERWLISYSEKGKKFGKLIIKPNVSSQFVRVYDLVDHIKRDTLLYKCKCGKMVTINIKRDEAYGDEHHKCQLVDLEKILFDIKKYTLLYEKKMSDIKEFEMKFAAFTDMDLDRLKIIPNDSWEFGYAANGMEKGRIIVRDSDNNDLCYQFGLSGSSYVCTTCRVGSHSAFYNEDIQRLVATKCKKLLPYVQIMSRQAKFRERWAANFQIHDSSTKMRSSRGMRHVEAFNPKRKRTSRKRPKIENSSSFELPEEPELTTHQSEDDTAMDTHDYDDLQSTSSVVTAISEFLPHNLENQTNDPEFEHFHRPSSYWINCTCRYFGLPVYTTDAYKTWASLRTINFKLENVLPPKNNVKEFDSGYDLISYLLTGSVNSSTIIDKKLNQYIYNNYKEFGVVDNIRCVDLTYEDIGNIVFNQSMQLLHFYAVSRLFKCVVVVYDYDKVKKSVFDHGSDATIVVGIDVDCCFLFC